MMYQFRKWIVIVAVCIAVLLVGLVVLAIYALAKKESNYNRIAPAAANRHKPKQNENGTVNSEVDPGASNSGAVRVGSSSVEESLNGVANESNATGSGTQ